MSDQQPTFGRLVSVDLREAWTREDTHFTPWLAQDDNLRLLSDAIGLDLECQGQEQDVGPFRADILCKVAGEDTLVLIENQIERTDHTHLGQVITYAAGLDAVVVVWIARRFTEEHRAALDWLNEVSHEKIKFFGLEVELWRIGNSAVAPKFNVVVKPNDWSKVVKERSADVGRSEHQLFRRDFWDGFLRYLDDEGSTIRADKTPSTQSWMTWGLGRQRFALMGNINFRDGYIDAMVLAYDHDLYQALNDRKVECERAYGEPLIWDFTEQRRQNYARIRREEVDPMDRQQWPELWRWLKDNLERLDGAFRPIISSLTLPASGGTGPANPDA